MDWKSAQEGYDKAQKRGAQLSKDFDLRVGHRKLAGKQATCLITTPRPGSTASAAATSLCVSGQGTPLLIERSGENLRALRYSTHVDDARFRLPSRPRE